MRPTLQRQRGVAVITALLLTTLAITIVASLFWQQQVQVRSIENQRLQLQKQWILRGALDWARLILREQHPLIARQVGHEHQSQLLVRRGVGDTDVEPAGTGAAVDLQGRAREFLVASLRLAAGEGREQCDGGEP